MSKEVRKNLSKEHIDDMLKTFTNQQEAEPPVFLHRTDSVEKIHQKNYQHYMKNNHSQFKTDMGLYATLTSSPKCTKLKRNSSQNMIAMTRNASQVSFGGRS